MPARKPPDRHKKVLDLIERKRKVDVDLAKAVGGLALATAAPAGGLQVQVPKNARVTAEVDSHGVVVSLALNKSVLPHPGTPRFSVAIEPLQQGQNVLVIAPFAIDSPWAFEVRLLADGKPISEPIRDRGTDIGVRPSVAVFLVVS